MCVRGSGGGGCFKKLEVEGQKGKQRMLTFQGDNGICMGALLVLFSCLSHGAHSQFMANQNQLIQT